jgi:hypothetical protein
MVHEDEHFHVYPSIIGMGDDNEVTGDSFWDYYRCAPKVIMLECHSVRWDRVKATVE